MAVISINEINDLILQSDFERITYQDIFTPPIDSLKIVSKFPKNICSPDDIRFIRDKFFSYENISNKKIIDDDIAERTINFMLGKNIPVEQKEYLSTFFNEELKEKLVERYVNDIIPLSNCILQDYDDYGNIVNCYQPRVNKIPLKLYYDNGVTTDVSISLERLKEILLGKKKIEDTNDLLVIKSLIDNDDFFSHNWNSKQIEALKSYSNSNEWNTSFKNIMNHNNLLIYQNTKNNSKKHNYEVNASFISDIITSIPGELNKLEKTIYAYSKLCQILSYDSVYFMNSKIGRFENEVGNFDRENNNVVCHEFTYIFAEILFKLGVEYVSKNMTIIPNTGYFNGHSNLKYIVDNNVIFADSTRTIIGGDLTGQKFSSNLTGIRSELYDNDLQQEFSTAKSNVQKYIERENKLLSDMLPPKDEISSLGEKDKYILFNNYLINCQLNGIDFIAYANKLIDILDLNINTKIMYDSNDLSKTLLNIELIGYSNEGKQQTISYIIDADSKLIYDSITDEMQYKENLTKRTR